MAKKNHFTKYFLEKSNKELEEILTSSAHVHEAKLAAKWILEDRDALLTHLSFNVKGNENSNPYPRGFTFFERQSPNDKSKLKNKLIQVRKDFRIELIVYSILLFVAPYLVFRPGQTPLIERMSYWDAVGIFSILIIALSISSFIYKAYPKVRALQTDRKKIISCRVLGVEDSFSGKKRVLILEHHSLTKYRLSKFHTCPNEGDYIRLELSEHGNQLVQIEKITVEAYTSLSDKKDYENFHRKRFFEVLANVKADNVNWSEFFGLLVPKEDHFITPIILMLNTLVFVIMLIAGVDIYRPEVMDIINWGGNIKALTVDQGQYWRLVTSVFVHIGIPHLLMNALGFLFVAVLLEHILGRIRFGLIYLTTGLVASLVSVFWNTAMVSAGASGAIFGLYGFLLMHLVLRREGRKKMNGGLIATISIYIIYNLIMGLTGNIDNAAHIGGLISGMILGTLFRKTKHRRIKTG